VTPFCSVVKEKENNPMKGKSFLFTLVLLLLSASGAAARQPAIQPSQIAATALTPPLFSAAQSGCFVAGLNGTNATPQHGSAATGIAAFVLAPPDPVTTTRRLSYYIFFTDNTIGPQTSAEIRKGAPGVAGPMVTPLTIGNPISGTVSLTSTADLASGQLYVNIATAPHPDGELRGQILPGGGCFSAKLAGSNETPPNISIGTGTGIFLLVPPEPLTTTQQLLFSIGYTQTSSLTVGATIRKGARGSSGPVVSPLPFSSNPITGTIGLSSQNIADLVAGLLYVNISTGLVQLGEIRGQIEPLSNCFTATLAGANEVPPNTSTATGSGVFTLSGTSATTRTLAYGINYSATLTATTAHIHKAPPGVIGSVVIPFQVSRPISGTATLTSQQVIDLLSGLYYANIHSATYIQGEIRGQLVPVGCSSTYMPLSRR
jgi:CHRD domain